MDLPGLWMDRVRKQQPGTQSGTRCRRDERAYHCKPLSPR
jgi:hypothetical protein